MSLEHACRAQDQRYLLGQFHHLHLSGLMVLWSWMLNNQSQKFTHVIFKYFFVSIHWPRIALKKIACDDSV
jgi:hypothetical protein